MSTATMWLEDVAVGAEVTPLTVRPTTVQLFRFSAVTWNPHRIHYDREYARTEGYPDVLVQSHLHGCFLVRAVLGWAGPAATLRAFSWRNTHLAVPGKALVCTGEVTGVDGGLVTCALEERDEDGVLCAPAEAVVELPRKGAPA